MASAKPGGVGCPQASPVANPRLENACVPGMGFKQTVHQDSFQVVPCIIPVYSEMDYYLDEPSGPAEISGRLSEK